MPHRIGLREDNALDQPLDGASVLMEELPREMIQQLGVGRCLAKRSEVVDRRHDPAPEEVMPNAVDEGPGHQGVV